VAIDRESCLRKAEKLLRQGRLDAAIEAYLRVIEDQPNDWNTINLLGDLYYRSGDSDRAIAQYTRIADHFAREGFSSKATALYRKVLKIRPDDEHARLQSAEIAIGQGLLADAKAALSSVAERRLRRGDRRGAAEVRLRLASLDPADVTARLVAARASSELGHVADAMTRFKQAAADLMDRGRASDAVEVLAEAASLDPNDEEVRSQLVSAYLFAGDIPRAREYATTPGQVKAIATELLARGREEEALVLLAEVAALDPGDGEVRSRLVSAHLASGDLLRARQYATTPAQMKAISAEYSAQGHEDESLAVLAEAVSLDPRDVEAMQQLVRSYIGRNELDRAADCLASPSAEDDAALLLLGAEVQIRMDHADATRGVLQRLLDLEPASRDEIALLGCNLAETHLDTAFTCLDVASDAAVTDGDGPAAAAALHEFITRVPHHIPALIKLVEVCVDGGLEATMLAAQAQLADAYLTAGRAAEARVIAEDLVAREPWERVNIERFRRALVMLGESDPDALIADRLSGDAPFTSTDLALDEPAEIRGVAPPPDVVPPPDVAPAKAVTPSEAHEDARAGTETPDEMPASTPPPQRARSQQPDTPTPPARPRPAPAAPPPPPPSQKDVYTLGPGAIDLRSILGDEMDADVPTASTPEVVEIDLSGALTDLEQTNGTPPEVPMRDPRPDAPRPSNTDDAFAEFRHEVSREQAGEVAGQQLKVAVTYRDMGMIDEAMASLEIAARSPRHRFEAASMLARLHRERGQVREAIDWFERAAEAPATSRDAGRALLYDLAVALEEADESARALAVFMEIETDAADYRDVGARVTRLSKMQGD
jgi:tetratricopeptide (TPR) repeat protein